MTLPTQVVLRAALQEPTREWYGLQMCDATGLPSGTVYPIIARLERFKWIESRWEDPKEHVTQGRPRRRYYRFTEGGAEEARLALAGASMARGRALQPWGSLHPNGAGAI